MTGRAEQPDGPAVQPNQDEQALDFAALDGSPRRAFVRLPLGPEPFRAALILPGLARSGPPPVKGYVAGVAAALAARGVAAMRLEPPWSQPDGPRLEELDWQSEIDDAIATLRFLKQQPWVDSTQLYLVGLSLGGVVAPIIAGQVGGVAGILSWGATARQWGKYAVANLRHQLIWRGFPAQTIARAVELSSWWHQMLAETSKGAAQLLEENPGIAELDVTASGTLGRPTEFWRQLIRSEPVEAFQGLSCRICAVRGGSDFASHSADQQAIVRAAEQAGLAVQAVTMEGLDHLLREADSAAEACRHGGGHGEPDYARLARLIVAWMDGEALPPTPLRG